MSRTLALLFAFCLLAPLCARGEGEDWKAWVGGEAGFETLCAKASQRVDFFRRIWAADPKAVIYGGSSRDFVWHVRGVISAATSKEDFGRRVEQLLQGEIDVKDFVVGQSDIDIITSRHLTNIDYDQSFLTKIEPISPRWFEPDSLDSRYVQETTQGYVPVEKIWLTAQGFHRPAALEQGNGVREIFEGKPTLHLDPRIRGTLFYKQHGNHEILLVLRYLRQVAVAYYRLYGKTFPDRKKLMALMDDVSRRHVEGVLSSIRERPEILQPFVENADFTKRLNRALQKAFRSYTNPDATKMLFDEFGLDAMLKHFAGPVENYHTLLYQKHRDPAEIAAHRVRLGLGDGYLTTFEAFLGHDAMERGPDGIRWAPVYHGTAGIDNYRSIVLQSNVPSQWGTAGDGVYAADEKHKELAERRQGNETLVAKLRLAPNAVLVDLLSPEGKAAFDRFRATAWQTIPLGVNDYTAFADYVGADALRYSCNGTPAYVIKNGAVIRGQEGVTFPVLTTTQARADLVAHGMAFERFEQLVRFDPSLAVHWRYLLAGLDEAKVFDYLSRLPAGPKLGDLAYDPRWRKYPDRWVRVLEKFGGTVSREAVDLALANMDTYPPAVQDAMLIAMIKGDLDALTGAGRLLVTRPQWSPAMWDAVITILSDPKHLPGAVAKHELYKAIRFRDDAPLHFRELTPQAKGRLAGMINHQGSQIPRANHPISSGLEKIFGLSAAGVEAATAIASGKPLDASQFVAARAELGFTFQDVNARGAVTQALVYGGLARLEPGFQPPLSWQTLFDKLRLRMLDEKRSWHSRITWLPTEIEPTVDTLRAMLALPDVTEEARREVWEFVHGLPSGIIPVQIPFLREMRAQAPDIATPEQWRTLFVRWSEGFVMTIDNAIEHLRMHPADGEDFKRKHENRITVAIIHWLEVPRTFRGGGPEAAFARLSPTSRIRVAHALIHSTPHPEAVELAIRVAAGNPLVGSAEQLGSAGRGAAADRMMFLNELQVSLRRLGPPQVRGLAPGESRFVAALQAARVERDLESPGSWAPAFFGVSDADVAAVRSLELALHEGTVQPDSFMVPLRHFGERLRLLQTLEPQDQARILNLPDELWHDEAMGMIHNEQGANTFLPSLDIFHHLPGRRPFGPAHWKVFVHLLSYCDPRSLRLHAPMFAEILKEESHWPRELWDAMPALLSEAATMSDANAPRGQLLDLIPSALGNQPAWTETTYRVAEAAARRALDSDFGKALEKLLADRPHRAVVVLANPQDEACLGEIEHLR